MTIEQFLILIGILVVFFAALIILTVKLLGKGKDQSSLVESVSNAVSSAASEMEKRLNLKQDAVSGEHSRDIEQLKSSLSDSMSTRLDGVSKLLYSKTDSMSERITDKQDALQKNVSEQLSGVRTLLDTQANRNDERLRSFDSGISEKLRAVEAAVKELRETNEKQLDAIRGVVNEKLQQTLNERLSESFKRVDERLAEVYKGLGEMQTLASGVGDLKKVLSNVKTRGTLGEIQLRAILEEILAPEQYELNFDAGKGGNERVEFAVRLPNDGDNPVYLPIDSKFPADMYAKLCDAYDSADAQQVEAAQKNLRDSLLKFAKDIYDKYINPPRTTNFAVMFLPTEGLYAEAVRLGMIETLQTRYRINIAGPSTMAALLNSLQMGFRTLAIQKRSSEVWEILAKIKKEFNTFDDVLSSTRKALQKANDDLDKLVGVRTRKIRNALNRVEELPSSDGGDQLLVFDIPETTGLADETDDVD